MKVLFYADNNPVLEMYEPIIKKLDCDIVVSKINYEAIEKEKPDVIVMAREETTPTERKIINCGVPVILILHGILMPNIDKKLWGSNRFKNLYLLVIQGYRKLLKGDSIWRLIRVGLFRARNDYKKKGILSNYTRFTKIAAYGEFMKDMLVNYEVKLENIVITGNPKFDKYYNQPKNKNGYLLLLTEYFVEYGAWSIKQREQFVKDIYFATKQCGLDLVVKIHPVLEYREDYEKIAEKYPFKLYRDESIRDLILNCDMAITIMSSTGLEVMVAEKPLIIYNPYGEPTLYKEGVLTVNNYDELVSAINYAKNGISKELINASRAFVDKQIVADGKSAERIANLIMEMANARR